LCIKPIIKINEIVDITELSAMDFFTSSSSIVSCLDIIYTTKAVGAADEIIREFAQ
jgi:hypothetical protein